MAKNDILESLLGLLDPEDQARIRTKIENKRDELLGVYLGTDDEPVTVPPVAAHTPTVPSAATTTAAAATATPAADASAQILSRLESLSTSLDDRFKALDSKFIPAADLAKHQSNLLALAIKTADDINTIRINHRAVTGKELDRAAFEKFVEEAKLPNGTPKYASLLEAHEAYVAPDKTKAEIEKGIADGIKTRTSGATVPGQTQSIALSPAQQVMAKARAQGSTEGKSNAMAAAERLAAIVRARDEGSSASA